jgi:hypothetical protein
VTRFGERLDADLPRLLEEGEQAYHEYAFVTVRQCGAAWEAAQSFLEWLDDGAGGPYGSAAESYGALAATSKTLLFKLARAAAKGRALDAAPDIAELEDLWQAAVATLETELG